MATRGYPPQPQQQQHYYQHPPQGPPSRQHGYDQRADPRWQEPQQQRMPLQRQQQPHDGGRYEQYGYQEGYGQSQYHQEQHHQPQYHNGQPPQDHRGQPQPQRQYNYDERYHQNGQGRGPPPNGQGYQDPHRSRDRPGPSPVAHAQKPQKPRERILTRPESPKTLAWDNPFGAFPPKRKEGDKKEEGSSPESQKHKRHGSLDAAGPRPQEWATSPPLRLNQQEGRPHTSQGHRKQNEPPRPNTSHGQRHPMSPIQALPDDQWDLPHNVRPHNERAHNERIGPPPTHLPQNPRQQQQPPQRPERPPMSPTQSFPDDCWGRSKADLVGAAPHRPPMAHGDPRPGPLSRAATQPVSNMDPGIHSQGHHQPANRSYDIVTDRRPPPPRQVSDRQYERDFERGPPLTKAHTFDQPPISPEMPNFNAMAPNVAETLTGPKAVEVPAYAQKSYQAFAVDHRLPPPKPAESPLAEFAFDLPHSNSAPPTVEEQQRAMRRGQGSMDASCNRPERTSGDIDYNNPPLSPPVTAARPSGGYDARIPPHLAQKDQGRSTPVSQFPPRGASRAEGQSQPLVYPQQDSGYWTASPEQKAGRADAGYDRAGGPRRGMSNEYDQGYGYDQGYNDQYQQEPHDQYGQHAPHRPGLPPPNMMQGPPRPHTANSAHPPPVRNYGGRPGGPNGPPPATGGFDRPPPVRPGLMNQQPPPQQQHQMTPHQQPPAMRQPPPMRTQQVPMPVQPPPEQRRQSNQSAEEVKPPVTIAELNSMREQFKERPNDFTLGMRFAKRLVEAAKVLSSENGRADQKTTLRNRERYINDAHKVVKKMVNAGSTEAMFYLADCYGQGSLGLPVDAKEAFHLYQSAAKLNHPQSAYRVAVCCELGNEDGGGTRRDPMKAIQWYKRAATLGDTPAMYKMGMILLKGLLGQPRNPREAVSWLKRAAERADKENPHALHELGLLYESARPEDHILRDEQYAYQLFHQAAELGYKYSQFRLGSAFEYGALGLPIDQRQSIAWYSRAAALGEHQSELALSGWYLTGAEGLVKQSDQEAFLWARKAAMSGLPKAEFAMGYFAEQGIGTSVDVEEAKRWYYRAAAQGFPKAKERLEELKMGQKGKKRDIRRSNAKEGDCVVM